MEQLAHRCCPIVGGLLDRLAKRVEELGGRLKDGDILHVSGVVAHRLFFGTCNCLEDGDDKRMRRGASCGEEHKLRSWKPDQSLRAFLKLALINEHEEKQKNGKFQRADPAGIRADCFNLLGNRNPKDLARGMALRMIDLDVRGRSIRFGVFQIPKCEQCGDNVTIDNVCRCDRGCFPLPRVSKLAYIVDDVSVRPDPDSKLTPMYRSHIVNETCLSHGKDHWDSILLFPERNGEGQLVCPQCKLKVSGKPSNPQMEFRAAQLTLERLPVPAEARQRCNSVIDRLLEVLASVKEPESLARELTDLRKWVHEEWQRQGEICPELLREKISALSPEARECVQDRFGP